MLCNAMLGLHNSADADAHILDLNKSGYPAIKVDISKDKWAWKFVSSFECNSEDEMKKLHEEAHLVGFPFGNFLKDGPNADKVIRS